jgi:hypothetical protein
MATSASAAQANQRAATRWTLSFAKKLANHVGFIKYFICHYNLARATT